MISGEYVPTSTFVAKMDCISHLPSFPHVKESIVASILERCFMVEKRNRSSHNPKGKTLEGTGAETAFPSSAL